MDYLIIFLFFIIMNGPVLAQEKKVFKVDPEEMVLIPAGEFMMGSSDGTAYINEHPLHKVFLDAYYMDKYEVTNRAFKKFVEETEQRPSPYMNTKGFNQPMQPVVGVVWEEAVNYCKWRGKQLPTEAQWEKAARGTEPKKYPWGNMESIKEDDYLANYHERIETTTSVGSYPEGKSIYGVYDLAGNAFEWVSDWYTEDYYKNSPAKNPTGPETGEYHVRRGGSWLNDAQLIRTSARSFFMPGSRKDIMGFRCVYKVE